MAFRRIEIPSLGRALSNVMAHPSSADADGHEAALDEYLRLGGNCIHLHGEGGEVHSRIATGQWLRRDSLRREFFLCTQICHAGWDSIGQCAIDRFNAKAVKEDIDTELQLLGTEYLDLAYLDDNPQAPLESVLEAIGHEITRGRLRAFGVRNWAVERINAARGHISREALPGVSVIVTTELSLAAATAPLWPEYVPFDRELRRMVKALGLAVFAHAADVNLGQCLYGDGDATTRFRPQWLHRWDHPANQALVPRVQRFATAHEITPREVNVAWLLNQPFPSVAVAPLPSMRGTLGTEYERASQFVLEEAELASLSGGLE